MYIPFNDLCHTDVCIFSPAACLTLMLSSAWLCALSSMVIMLDDQSWPCELQFLRMEMMLNEVKLIEYNDHIISTSTRLLRENNRGRLLRYFINVIKRKKSV